MTTSMADLNEIGRSAKEASKTKIKNVDLSRYEDPPASTPHSLEYAFHLLGDVCGNLILDLGCGSGENIVPLSLRGANVIGMDISSELICLAVERVCRFPLPFPPLLYVGSAYDTKLPALSVDVVFCMSLLHHLDIERVKEEILRVLKPGGVLIVKEPIRFSRSMKRIRKLFPAKEDISENEYPLNEAQIATLCEDFAVLAQRDFRTPLGAVASKFPFFRRAILRADCLLVKHLPASFATIRVMKLRSRRIAL